MKVKKKIVTTFSALCIMGILAMSLIMPVSAANPGGFLEYITPLSTPYGTMTGYDEVINYKDSGIYYDLTTQVPNDAYRISCSVNVEQYPSGASFYQHTVHNNSTNFIEDSNFLAYYETISYFSNHAVNTTSKGYIRYTGFADITPE